MGLAPGSKIGNFEILAMFGAGGMGEVYRAKDLRLGRIVALKVLPPHLAQDHSYLARFEREAQALAALNHPSIAAIYGIEINAIVMEAVEGETLAQKGPVPLTEALGYARQIASALEAAHECGIVHRDLKPANIKLRPDGTIKILDFGLAKISDSARSAASDANSPTLSLDMTREGIILGTAAYMSPEQAAGKEVDRRADIWSFGVVLFELLTGKRLFDGESVSHTLADVLRAPIDFGLLPQQTPMSVRKLLERCLERKLSLRLQWIGEARILIDRIVAGQEEEPQPALPVASRGRIAKWVAAVAGLLVLTSGTLYLSSRRQGPTMPQRFTIQVGDGLRLPVRIRGPRPTAGPTIVLSPEDERIAFVGLDAEGQSAIYIRELSQLENKKLPGTEGGAAPFFSPDGRWVGFFSGRKLKKISIEGGAPIELCDSGGLMGASWGNDGYIYASLVFRGGISKVPEVGGAPVPITKPEQVQRAHRWPHLMRGQNILLYSDAMPAASLEGKIVAQRLGSSESRVVLEKALFAGSLPGNIITFVREDNLFAARFDPAKLALEGDPIPILDSVLNSSDSGGAQMHISNRGTIVYRRQSAVAAERPLGWIDQQGKFEALQPLGTTQFPMLALSPDGKRFAYSLAIGTGLSIWVREFNSDQPIRISADGAAINDLLIWTPDSKRIAFQAKGAMYWARGDGSGNAVKLLEQGSARGFLPDGKGILYTVPGQSSCLLAEIQGSPDAPKLSAGVECKSVPPIGNIITTEYEVSPDGRWVAYTSFETSVTRVMVADFQNGGSRYDVSLGSTSSPHWSPDGRQLYFLDAENKLRTVDIAYQGQALRIGSPRLWSPALPAVSSAYSVEAGGKRVLLRKPEPLADRTAEMAEVVLHFQSEVERKLQSHQRK